MNFVESALIFVSVYLACFVYLIIGSVQKSVARVPIITIIKTEFAVLSVNEEQTYSRLEMVLNVYCSIYAEISEKKTPRLLYYFFPG